MQPFLSTQTRAAATFNAPVVAADKSRSTALNHLAAADKSRSTGLNHLVAARPAGGAGGAGGATPAIECVRDGDRVSRLIVICACGERIEIDCLYNG